MQRLTRKQLVLLIALTIFWGLNWPLMKIAVADYPPLTFRALSLWLSVPVMVLVLRVTRTPLSLPRERWRDMFWLAFFNMMVWHALIILAVKLLSGGRAAVLGYSMPVFSALFGAWIWGDRLTHRAGGGVVAAALGIALLLWHEISGLTGHPLGVLLALGGAAAFGLGTQMLRRSAMPVSVLTITFWMLLLASISMSLLALLFERDQWSVPMPTVTLAAVIYSGLIIFSFAHTVWFFLARTLPPVASTLSVMMIPVIGVFSGALFIGEVLHWQDYAAVLLLMVSMASVLWPVRPAR